MSDLISRSELIKRLEDYKNEDWNKKLCIMLPNVVDDCIDFVENQTTAYDIDKVVEELQKIEEHCLEMNDWQGQSAVVEAIEIVKQSCVNDDVCEWKEDAYGRWHTQCNILADNSPLEYTYCPYCSKKIKGG